MTTQWKKTGRKEFVTGCYCPECAFLASRHLDICPRCGNQPDPEGTFNDLASVLVEFETYRSWFGHASRRTPLPRSAQPRITP